jgi:crotonobetainyl-CoA:carnitine CoA-transferase CaiB-like acyl-CoA transferase
VISGAVIGPQGPPPHVGEHTDEVLTELLGLTADELGQLYAAGTIHTTQGAATR